MLKLPKTDMKKVVYQQTKGTNKCPIHGFPLEIEDDYCFCPKCGPMNALSLIMMTAKKELPDNEHNVISADKAIKKLNETSETKDVMKKAKQLLRKFGKEEGIKSKYIGYCEPGIFPMLKDMKPTGLCDDHLAGMKVILCIDGFVGIRKDGSYVGNADFISTDDRNEIIHLFDDYMQAIKSAEEDGQPSARINDIKAIAGRNVCLSDTLELSQKDAELVGCTVYDNKGNRITEIENNTVKEDSIVYTYRGSLTDRVRCVYGIDIRTLDEIDAMLYFTGRDAEITLPISRSGKSAMRSSLIPQRIKVINDSRRRKLKTSRPKKIISHEINHKIMGIKPFERNHQKKLRFRYVRDGENYYRVKSTKARIKDESIIIRSERENNRYFEVPAEYVYKITKHKNPAYFYIDADAPIREKIKTSAGTIVKEKPSLDEFGAVIANYKEVSKNLMLRLPAKSVVDDTGDYFKVKVNNNYFFANKKVASLHPTELIINTSNNWKFIGETEDRKKWKLTPKNVIDELMIEHENGLFYG